MILSVEDVEKSNEAINFVKTNARNIINRFSDPKIFLPSTKPVSVFMAGAPGVGKTEFSKNLCERFSGEPPVRIDPDEIRKILPGYNGSNSFIFQKACSKGVDKIYDACIKNKQNLVLDGTLYNYEKSETNIYRSINKGRRAEIYFLYQDPVIAWSYTKKREVVEGRNIPKEAFIDSLMLSRENVDKLKKKFGGQLIINIAVQDADNNLDDLGINVGKIDEFLKMSYPSREDLNKALY